MIIRPFGISVHLQTNPISTPHARVTEWRDVITKRATLLTTQTWSRSRPLSWADAIGRIWWQVVAIYRGTIEIDHSYGLRCRGLCWHLRHSTRGTGRRGRKRPRDGRSHSCCAGGVSTNHSSADRIVVNSYNNSLMCSNISARAVVYRYYVYGTLHYICVYISYAWSRESILNSNLNIYHYNAQCSWQTHMHAPACTYICRRHF